MELVKYDAMCRAIAECLEIDEVKDIRDKALALEVYARQVVNTDAERQACEIRLRAEKKAGRLLRERVKAKGAAEPGWKNALTSQEGVADKPKTLEELGITYNQAAQWQKLDEQSDEEFERNLGTLDKLSTSAMIRAGEPEKEKPPVIPVAPEALWLWGTLRDFCREGMLDRDFTEVLSTMTDGMRADVIKLAPIVAEWLKHEAD